MGKSGNMGFMRPILEVRLDVGNHIGACFMYTRRAYEAVGEYDPELFLVEDYDYFIRIAKQFPLCHIAEPLYYFRRDDATLYCSRFAEVKASDILVRHKNGLIDEGQLLQAMIGLITRNPEDLANPVLRWVYGVVKGLSYRLSQWNSSLTHRYLGVRLRSPVAGLLAAYRQGTANFGQTRDALRDLMQRHGRIEYKV
jgi:hypothetical protein